MYAKKLDFSGDNMLSGQNKKNNISSLLSAELAQRVVKVYILVVHSFVCTTRNVYDPKFINILTCRFSLLILLFVFRFSQSLVSSYTEMLFK